MILRKKMTYIFIIFKEEKKHKDNLLIKICLQHYKNY